LKCAHAALCFQEENRCQEEKKTKQNWKIICIYSYIFFKEKAFILQHTLKNTLEIVL